MSGCFGGIFKVEFSDTEIREAVQNGRLLSMEIEFSRACNFRCPYCYAPGDEIAIKELTKIEIFDAVLQAKELGARRIIILGGEPMIYPHLFEILEFIQKEGMESHIFSNGSNVTPENARRLLELGVSLVLKMNTLDEKKQNLLAGQKGAFQVVQAALKNAKEAGYPTEKQFLGVGTIICRQNIDELAEFWRWLRDQKITPYFEMITPQGRANDNEWLNVSSEEIRDLFFKISEIDREKYGVKWEPQPPLVGHRCLRHLYSCFINAYGKVMPCVGVNIPLGDIRENKLKMILQDSEVLEDLKDHGKKIKGPCGSCEKADFCYGCRGAAYQLTGDYLASDPLCWKNQEKQDEIVRLPVAVDRLIPQAKPMKMVDELVWIGERAAKVKVTITADNLFVREDGTLEESVYLELIAQAIAAGNGFRLSDEECRRQTGFLIGAKKIEVLGSVRVGDVLEVSVFKSAQYGEFGIVEGSVSCGGKIVARGEIKVWHSVEDKATKTEERL
ncbi:MAG: radical SAM protein [Candidatus Omnitrophota bacterium]